jgi:hypothetical protein
MKAFVLPAWLIKAVVTALISAFITGASAWGIHLSSKSSDHEKRIAVVEDHQKGIDKSLDEIKDTQKQQSQDLKEILKRLPRR